MQEKVVKIKKCKKCNSEFEITDFDLRLYEKVSPSFLGEKFLLPTPTLCPDCREKRRMIFRNERKLFKRKCDLTGKDIISNISPDKKYLVYDNEVWWGDKWDAKDYGQDYDFDKNFFDQYNELSLKKPRFALTVFESENSNYNNFIGKAKNCYYSFASGLVENIYYSYWAGWSNNIYDSYNTIKSENLYNSIDSISCNNSKYLFGCEGCSFSEYLKDCIGCFDCIACVGLGNKQYYIGNKEYTKEEYGEKKSKLSNDDILKLYEETYKNSFFRNFTIFNSENSIGEYIKNSKNLINGYICDKSTDSKNILWGFELDSSMDIDLGNNSNKIYEVISGGFCHNVLFSSFPFESNNLIYSDNCFYCSNCFGCIGLKNKEYNIFNKQYTKQEYEKLVPKIIEHMKKTGEWGEFFPSNLSPFGYNETVAIEYFPKTKEEAIKEGFNWLDYETPFPKVEKIIPASKLPENIEDIPDDILNWAIECEVTKKPFRIIKEELDYYRKNNISIPKRHPDRRHLDRMKLRNKRKIYDRKCDNCNVDIKTTFNPKGEEKIYCEKCYDKEIY